MIEDTITIYRCDRCGEKAQSENEHDPVFYHWGHVWFAQINGPIYNKDKNIPHYFSEMNDLCPDCMIELNEWYKKPKTGNF